MILGIGRGGPRGGGGPGGPDPPFSERMKQNLDKIEILTTTLVIFLFLIFNTVTRISADGVPVALYLELCKNGPPLFANPATAYGIARKTTKDEEKRWLRNELIKIFTLKINSE